MLRPCLETSRGYVSLQMNTWEKGIAMHQLISPDSRRAPPPADERHYHVWLDHHTVLVAHPARFATRQAARNAAFRSGLRTGSFRVLECEGNPCGFELLAAEAER